METASEAPANTQKQPRSSPSAHNPPPKTSSVARHERLCKICQHAQREDIDDDILRWRSPQDIVYDFDLGDRSVVYRHGRALNLFSQRKKNLNPALERVIESVYDAKPSMNAVLKAMAIYARINGNAAFNDPPKRTIITHVTVDSEAAAARIAQILATASQFEHPATPAPCTQTEVASPSVPRDYPDDTPASAPDADANDATETMESVSHQRGNHSRTEPPEADAHPAANLGSMDKLRNKLAEVLESRPDIAKALATLSCAFVILASLFLASCTSFISPASSFSFASSFTHRSIAYCVPIGFSPLATSHSLALSRGGLALRHEGPLPFSYSLQNLRSQNANLLKTGGKAIFYPPQKRTFHGRFGRPQRADFWRQQSVEGAKDSGSEYPAEDASRGTGGFDVEAGDA